MTLGSWEALHVKCPLKSVESLTDEGTYHNVTINIRLCLEDIVSSVASLVMISAYIRDEINRSLGIEIWNRSSTSASHSKAPFESTGVMLLTLAEGLFHLLLFNCRQNDISLFDSYQRDNHSSISLSGDGSVPGLSVFRYIIRLTFSLEAWSCILYNFFSPPSTVQVGIFFFQNF